VRSSLGRRTVETALITLSGIAPRVLTIKGGELRIQFGLRRAKSERPLEESLSCHREKLGGIRRALGIEESCRSRFVCSLQRFEFATHHSRPRQVLIPSEKSGRTVCLGILKVELMCELV
jgi:hypothetical protein